MQALWFIQVSQLKSSNLKIIPMLQPPGPRQLSTFRMAGSKPSQQLWGEALMLVLQVNFKPHESFAPTILSDIQMFCRSYDHMITGCRKIHTERLGRNPVNGSKIDKINFPKEIFSSSIFVHCRWVPLDKNFLASDAAPLTTLPPPARSRMCKALSR